VPGTRYQTDATHSQIPPLRQLIAAGLVRTQAMRTTYCPNCGDENSLDTDEAGQLYCTACDYDIADDDDTANPPDRDPIPYEDDEPNDDILAQQELSDFAQDDCFEYGGCDDDGF